jgi:hypothetical protein
MDMHVVRDHIIVEDLIQSIFSICIWATGIPAIPTFLIMKISKFQGNKIEFCSQ